MQQRPAHLHEDVVRMAARDMTRSWVRVAVPSPEGRSNASPSPVLWPGSPKLIVLDEPTSAVDGRTEKLIRRTLSELRGRVTIVIISHRIETTAQCDQLLVPSDGSIADFGDRDAVLAGSAYQNIVLSRTNSPGRYGSKRWKDPIC